MDIRHIDMEVSVKKWVGEEDEQNVYKNLFNRRVRIDMNFPMNMSDEVFRRFMHDRLDKILYEIQEHSNLMEAK